MQIVQSIKNAIRGRPISIAENTTLQMDAPYVVQAINLLTKVFNFVQNKYEVYDALVNSDPELAGAIDTKATFIAKIIGGFTLLKGKTEDVNETLLQEDLSAFHRFMQRYYYDIAYKVLRDGNAVYLNQLSSHGIRDLDYLPMASLTCIEAPHNQSSYNAYQITKRGMYVLSEGDISLETPYPVSKVVHFDLGRKDKVIDIRGRVTYNVWNESPMESLRAEMLWRTSIIINDMLWRERNVPREHHKLPSAPFNPDNYPGRTPADRLAAATKAAKESMDEYKKNITDPNNAQYIRVDQGYVTLDNVTIEPVQFAQQHTDPNELIDQINKSVNKVYVPESTISGGVKSSFATENAVMLYTTIKSERIADAIMFKLIDLAKHHLRNIIGRGYTEDQLNRIIPKTNKILETHTLVRDAAILLETRAFTRDQIREKLGELPLTDKEKQEIENYGLPTRSHTETPAEITSKGKKRISPERPITPQSESQQQQT